VLARGPLVPAPSAPMLGLYPRRGITEGEWWWPLHPHPYCHCHCTALHCTALHCTALHCTPHTALDCTSPINTATTLSLSLAVQLGIFSHQLQPPGPCNAPLPTFIFAMYLCPVSYFSEPTAASTRPWPLPMPLRPMQPLGLPPAPTRH
jgi:hypothetical protein